MTWFIQQWDQITVIRASITTIYRNNTSLHFVERTGPNDVQDRTKWPVHDNDDVIQMVQSNWPFSYGFECDITWGNYVSQKQKMPKRKYCGYSSFLFTGKRFPRLLFFFLWLCFHSFLLEAANTRREKKMDWPRLLVAFIFLFCLDFVGITCCLHSSFLPWFWWLERPFDSPK